ncbi:MAG: SH3 domain-containing protein [Pseudomonadota bacterium]|nr:SH3 domain-containing protein [Pseudomonadota bacterium]
MTGWGTPEQEAERRRMQAEEERRRREQEAARRYADHQARQRAEEARRRADAERTMAMMDGASGNVHSPRRFSNPGSFIMGSVAAGRDAHTGKSRYETTPHSAPQTTRPLGGQSGTRRKGFFAWIEDLILWAVRLIGFGIFAVIGYFILDHIGVFDRSPSAPSRSSTAVPATLSLTPVTHFITADRLNIRTGPGVNHPSLGTQQGNSCIRVIATLGSGWSQVVVPTSSGPEIHYAASRFLQPLGPADNCR